MLPRLFMLPGLLLILLLLVLGLLSAPLPAARVLRAMSVLRAVLLTCHSVKPPGVLTPHFGWVRSRLRWLPSDPLIRQLPSEVAHWTGCGLLRMATAFMFQGAADDFLGPEANGQ